MRPTVDSLSHGRGCEFARSLPGLGQRDGRQAQRGYPIAITRRHSRNIAMPRSIFRAASRRLRQKYLRMIPDHYSPTRAGSFEGRAEAQRCYEASFNWYPDSGGRLRVCIRNAGRAMVGQPIAPQPHGKDNRAQRRSKLSAARSRRSASTTSA